MVAYGRHHERTTRAGPVFSAIYNNGGSSMRLLRITTLAVVLVGVMTSVANAACFVCRPGYGCFIMKKLNCEDLDIGNFPGILCADLQHVAPTNTGTAAAVNERKFPSASSSLEQFVLRLPRSKGDHAQLVAQLDQRMAKDRTVFPYARAKPFFEAPAKR